MLFMLVMTSALMGGNDLADNLAEAAPESARRPEAAQEAEPSSLMHRAIAARREILAWSNLIRVSYFVWGPSLRVALSPEPPEKQLEIALGETRRQLERFRNFAKFYNFKDIIYLLHPVQDLLGDTYPKTIKAIHSIAPEGMDVVSTAHAYLDNPRAYFFSYNGHFNAKGAQRLAEFLATEETTFVP